MAQLNYNDFANQVKKKLPEYASMDNLSLARKMEAEYPQYKGKIAYPEKVKTVQQKTNPNQYMSPARPQQLQSSTNPEAYMSKLQGNPNDINSRLGVQGAINNARQPIQDLVDQATMPVKSASQLKFEAAMSNKSPAQYTQNFNANKMVEDELARRATIKQNNVVESELRKNPVTPMGTAVDTALAVPKGAIRGMSTSAAQGIGALEQMIPIQAVQEHGKSITDFYENAYNNPDSFLYKTLGVPMKYQQGGMFDNPANALVNLGSAAGEMAPILLSGAIGGKAATKAAQKMLPSITEKGLQNAGSLGSFTGSMIASMPQYAQESYLQNKQDLERRLGRELTKEENKDLVTSSLGTIGINSALNAIPVMHGLNSFNPAQVANKGFKAGAKNALAQILEEGLTEAGEQTTNELQKAYLGNSEGLEQALKNIGESGLAGGILGGVFGAGGNVVANTGKAQQPVNQQEAQQLMQMMDAAKQQEVQPEQQPVPLTEQVTDKVSDQVSEQVPEEEKKQVSAEIVGENAKYNPEPTQEAADDQIADTSKMVEEPVEEDEIAREIQEEFKNNSNNINEEDILYGGNREAGNAVGHIEGDTNSDTDWDNEETIADHREYNQGKANKKETLSLEKSLKNEETANNKLIELYNEAQDKDENSPEFQKYLAYQEKYNELYGKGKKKQETYQEEITDDDFVSPQDAIAGKNIHTNPNNEEGFTSLARESYPNKTFLDKETPKVIAEAEQEDRSKNTQKNKLLDRQDVLKNRVRRRKELDKLINKKRAGKATEEDLNRIDELRFELGDKKSNSPSPEATIKPTKNENRINNTSEEKTLENEASTPTENERFVEREAGDWAYGENPKNYHLLDANGRSIGYIEYSDYGNDAIALGYVRNTTQGNRKGIGTKLVDKMVSENPGKIIVWDAVDEKAEKFKDAYSKKHPELNIFTSDEYNTIMEKAKESSYESVKEFIDNGRGQNDTSSEKVYEGKRDEFRSSSTSSSEDTRTRTIQKERGEGERSSQEIDGKTQNGDGETNESQFKQTKSSAEHAHIRDRITKLAQERRSVIDKGNYEASVAINKVTDKSKEIGEKYKTDEKTVRELMTFLRECDESNISNAKKLLPKQSGKTDKFDYRALYRLHNKLSQKDLLDLKHTIDNASNELEQQWEQYKEYKDAYFEDKSEIGNVSNYILHSWDKPKTKTEPIVGKRISKTSQSEKNRIFKTYKQGIDYVGENGEVVIPNTLDAAELLKMHSKDVMTKIANGKFAKILGNNVIAPNTDNGKIISYSYNPEFKKPLEAVLGSETQDVKEPTKARQAYRKVNNLFKRYAINIGSLFHHSTLSESRNSFGKGIEAILPTNAIKTQFNAIKSAFKDGDYEVFKRIPEAKEALKYGVKLGVTNDIDIESARKDAEKILGKKFGRFANKVAERMDKVLWDSLANTYKINTFNDLVDTYTKYYEDKKKGELPESVKRELAQFVNDSFGGQNYDTLQIKDSAVKTANDILLSTDWTLSTMIRQSASVLSSEKMQRWLNKVGESSKAGYELKELLRKAGIGSFTNDIEAAGIRGKAARIMFAKALVQAQIREKFMTGLNLLVCYGLAKDGDDEDDKPTVGELFNYNNQFDREFLNYLFPDYFIGRDDKKIYDEDGEETGEVEHNAGKEMYVKQGKQFKEIPELVQGGLQYFGWNLMDRMASKMSPLISGLATKGVGTLADKYGDEFVKNKYGWKKDIKKRIPYTDFEYDSAIPLGMPFALSNIDKKTNKANKLVASIYSGVKEPNSYQASDEIMKKLMKGDSNIQTEEFSKKLRRNGLKDSDYAYDRMVKIAVREALENKNSRVNTNREVRRRFFRALKDYGYDDYDIQEFKNGNYNIYGEEE